MSTEKNYFNTDHLKANLKQHSVRGGVVTVAAQASKFILKFGSTMVLARLLIPEDYGLIGMATVAIGFVEYFKDLGLSAATIQRSEINHRQISTLFWINLGVGCLVALVVALLAPAIAAFYREPRLQGITLVLAVNFIFGGLTVQHQALLRRQMQFVSLAKIEITAMATGVVTAIAAAYYGLGYWALVVMLVATVVSNAIGVWLVCSWRPGLPRPDAEIGSMLAYGGNLTGFSLVNYFSRNLDNILIGRRWGSQQLGLYAQAYRLLLLPIQQINNPINSVALPTLASLQTEPEKYSRYYYKAILLITTLGMPIVAFMFATAEQLILLLLGQQWLGAVPLFKYLMPAAFVGTFNVAAGWVYQSLGRTDRQFRFGVLVAIIYGIIFAISVNWGAIGVARAYGVAQPILIFVAIAYCYLDTHLKFKTFVKTIARPAFASIGAAIALMAIEHFIITANYNLLLSFLVDCLLYGLLYLILWLVLPGGKQTLLEIGEIFKVVKQKSRPK
ncbi:MAG: lipopolysaccharide biosynthesis protein [Pleurocapsa sp. MO_226.B13]|nr:lipopolysaccharide biosynthesis protein [Pleurocapsa sp. MO_226.B13]